MPYHNQVVLTGHLGQDPEYKISNSGKGYTTFSLAVQREYNDDEVDFFNCVAFDRGNYKLGEYIAENTRKGKLVTVIGRIQIDEWEKEGQKHRPPKVIVDKCIYERNKTESGGLGGFDEYDFDLPDDF
jgi:single-strand DNA-binding protein